MQLARKPLVQTFCSADGLHFCFGTETFVGPGSVPPDVHRGLLPFTGGSDGGRDTAGSIQVSQKAGPEEKKKAVLGEACV